MLSRRRVLGSAAALGASFGCPAIARAQASSVKIGVLTDMSGIYATNTGRGSVLGATMAIEDYRKIDPYLRVELVSADQQNKPDVALTLSREWIDRAGVDCIIDVPISSAALGVANLVKERDRVALFTAPASSDLTGSACTPNSIHWTYDSWALNQGTVQGIMAGGGDTWFFLTADYAFGKALQRDAATAVTEQGGKVIGNVLTPSPSNDFSSFLLQAQTSGAKVVGLAQGGQDVVTCIKQAAEFGMMSGKQRVAGLVIQLGDVHGMGLAVAGGLLLSEPFYWDLTDGTRAFSQRFGAQMNGQMPSIAHAGAYSAVLHYLKAVSALGVGAAKASGRATVERMKAIPTDDPLFGPGSIRLDGRKLHPMHLFQVKTPAESRGPYDYYKLIESTPPERAFRAANKGGCPLVPA